MKGMLMSQKTYGQGSDPIYVQHCACCHSNDFGIYFYGAAFAMAIATAPGG